MRMDHARRKATVWLASLPLFGWSAAKAAEPGWSMALLGLRCLQGLDCLPRANGFAVKSYDTGNAAVRARLGVRSMYGSCHTGLIDGYVVEGHVPVREIRRMLKERPDAIGIAVPAMPLGSREWTVPRRNKTEPHAVVLLTRDGDATVYQRTRTVYGASQSRIRKLGARDAKAERGQ